MGGNAVGRARLGAAALGISALLLAAFPLVRPFSRSFQEDPAGFARNVSSTAWLVSHLLAMAAFVLLPFGLLTLYAALADSRAERRAFVALVLSLAGVGLVLPVLGVETYALPALGRASLEGKNDLAAEAAGIYFGADTLGLLLAVVLLAVGGIVFASAVRRAGRLAGGAGLAFAVGLALWFPLLPREVRVVDGLLIGIGGLWLARSVWAGARDRRRAPDPVSEGAQSAHAPG